MVDHIWTHDLLLDTLLGLLHCVDGYCNERTLVTRDRPSLTNRDLYARLVFIDDSLSVAYIKKTNGSDS